MPELPEVETIRRQLEPAITGRVIESLRVLDERWTRPVAPREVERALAGRRIEAVERRGKYLLLRLDGDRTLAMHLRMTGNLLLQRARLGSGRPTWSRRVPPAGRACTRPSRPFATFGRRSSSTTERGCCSPTPSASARRWSWTATDWTTTSPRGWGSSRCRQALTGAELCRLASGRRAPLKSFLLNQSGVAGIGNIYADEALHRAALHPLSPAGSMKPEDCERLRDGIVATLEAGLRSGGASVDDCCCFCYRSTTVLLPAFFATESPCFLQRSAFQPLRTAPATAVR